MKLKKLSLANYRGFEQIDIEFEDDVTVIAGVNGVGKSGLLQAISQIISYVNVELTPSKEEPLQIESADISYQKINASISATFQYAGLELFVDINKKLPQTTDDRTKLEEERNRLRFAVRNIETGSKEELELEEALELLNYQLSSTGRTHHNLSILPTDPNADTVELRNTVKTAQNQPIAVAYSTQRFLSRLSPKLTPVKKIDIANAYTKSLSGLEISLHDFSNWYRFIEQNTASVANASKPLIFKQLEDMLGIFLPGMSDLCFHETNPPKFSLLKDGQRFYLEQLSDGERGLLALVLDLTRRLSVANPRSDHPVQEGSAIVLIDEIELHLHPRWQRRVMRRLKETFKNCQFIVTTHSPQVIGQVRPEKLRLLHVNDDGKVVQELVVQSFGMDSGWILQNIMGGHARDYEIEQKLSGIYDAIDDMDLEQARESGEALRNEIGDFPELQECFALLDRLEMLAEDEED